MTEERDFGEVKDLLRRLETKSFMSASPPATQLVAQSAGDAPLPPRAAHGVSSAAALFLIANTAMATATITSIAWYLFHSAATRRSGELAEGSAFRQPAAGSLRQDNAAQVQAASQRAAATWAEIARTKREETPPGTPTDTGSPAAHLVIPETLHVVAGQGIRIPIVLEPLEAARSVDQISLTGLPAQAALNRGSQSSPDRWTVPAGALSELEVAIAAETDAGRFQLRIAALTNNGRELTSSRSTLVVARPQAPGTATLLDPESQSRYLERARSLLDIGQIGAARLVLQRAAEAGNADAALLLGDTYDPVKLFEMGARGIVGDLEKAAYWYEKADELGSPAAKARIIGLGRN